MCTYKSLFIFVEGSDDERFFNKILVPKLKEEYDEVRIIKYASEKKEKIDNYIKTITKTKVNYKAKKTGYDMDYIYVTDINHSPCITVKKEEIQSKYKNIDNDKIIIVLKEIEGWYLAGLNNKKIINQLKIKNFNNTNNITKENFNDLIPKKFTSRIDFMVEILKNFSVAIAKQKNSSFEYFIKKYTY